MVEGGGVVHTQFLSDDLVDELQLVVAPFFIGDSRAPSPSTPAPPRAGRPGRGSERVRRTQATTSTTAPGRLATNTITP